MSTELYRKYAENVTNSDQFPFHWLLRRKALPSDLVTRIFRKMKMILEILIIIFVSNFERSLFWVEFEFVHFVH